MKNNKGFTLVELMVVMVITIIMLIAVGAVTGVGKTGYNKIASETAYYNNVAYGLKLIQNRIHETKSTITEETLSSPWISERLIVGNEAFGVYDMTGGFKDFVYLPDKNETNPANYRSILRVPDSDTLTSTFTITGDKVIVNIDINVVQNNSQNIDVDMSTTIIKRI